MSNSKMRLLKNGVAVPQVRLPKEGVDLSRWAVIACDQFTSNRAYWEETEKTVGEAPSTLRMILPEVFLEDKDADRPQLIASINKAMDDYREEGVLAEGREAFIFIKRSTPHSPQRLGLLIAVDLEAYDFSKGSKALIRPTEKTVIDRLPPRMEIRKGAALDIPHILLLMDDHEERLMEKAEEASVSWEKLYKVQLMQNGGAIEGWAVDESFLPVLADFTEKKAREGLLFAVGDGNHSLAAAKSLWEEKKAAGAPDDDPARYAMAELGSIYDPGYAFHPIHRVIFNAPLAVFAEAWEAEAERLAALPGEKTKHSYVCLHQGEEKTIEFQAPQGPLTVEYFQAFLDEYVKARPEASLDYIHGKEEVKSLSEQENTLGVLLPDIRKEDFFPRILNQGVYPRKTFSIGEGIEKRYYLECRDLK